MKRFIWMIFMVLIGCATAEKQNPSEALVAEKAITQQLDYDSIIEKYSAGRSVYDGFTNLFQFRGTLITSAVIEAQLQRQSGFLQWDASKLAEEREKKLQQASTKTQIFLSFFVPTRSENNLATAKTIWRVFLDTNGRRYVGEVKKMSQQIAEIASLYPYHNRWSVPYMVSFPVPTQDVEKKPAQLTITGSIGTSTVTFEP